MVVVSTTQRKFTDRWPESSRRKPSSIYLSLSEGATYLNRTLLRGAVKQACLRMARAGMSAEVQCRSWRFGLDGIVLGVVGDVEGRCRRDVAL